MWTRMSGVLFQNRCVFCQESALPQRDMCQFCVDDLPTSKNSCTRCAIPVSTRQTLVPGAHSTTGQEIMCGNCSQRLPPIQRTIAYCRYAYPADFLVQQLKFSGQLKYARVIGVLLAESVKAASISNVNMIVPVPLSLPRYRQRGFNQAAEIARFVGASLSTPVNARLLSRCLDQPPQAGLGRKLRERNIVGAFRCRKSMAGLRCALVDDVMTTGATVYEAARTLRQAGAESVEVWVFARTVHEEGR